MLAEHKIYTTPTNREKYMSRLSYWKDSTTWICSKHLPSIEVPSSMGACPFVGCDSIRPRHGRPTPTEGSTSETPVTQASSTTSSPTPSVTRAKKKAPTPVPAVELCNWFKCDKGENGDPAPSRPRSKYCSKDCSNKNARHRYKTKQKK